jgi:vancomycin aglycone glucosyltransferase
MRMLLSTYGSRGDVEPMAALAVQLRALGADALVCAPPDEEFARLLSDLDVPLIPVGEAVRPLVTGRAAPSTTDPIKRTAGILSDQYAALIAAAEGCDAIVATGLFPVVAAARSVADALDLRFHYVSLQPTYLPSPHHPPPARPGHPLPAGVTDNRALWRHDAESMNALFGDQINAHRTLVGLPPVDSVRDHAFTERPWLATDPLLSPWPSTDLDVHQTGAWLLPGERSLSSERSLPAELEAFLDAGTSPVYIGFGSIPISPAATAARVAVGAARAQGLRVVLSSGWADLATIDERDDCIAIGEVDHRALFPWVAAVVHHGGAGTTVAAALAGAPQVVVPQIADQPYWARRAADLGIGVVHDRPAMSIRSLSAAIAAALTPQIRTRATEVAAEIRPDGAASAAKRMLAG